MGKYNGAVITTAGANVISQAISGTELTWTVMRSSSVALPEGTDIAALTSLTGIEQTAAITDASVYGSNTIQVSARFSNTGVDTAYLLETIGIYGQLSGGAETLIAVMTAVTPDQMPVYDADSPSAFIYNSQITVQDAETVVMTVNDSGTATVADLNRKVNLNGGDLSDTKGETFTSSTASYPVISAGDTFKVMCGKIAKFCADIVKPFTKATASAAGAKGLVPAPAAGEQIAYLRGDGTWKAPVFSKTTTETGLSLDAREANPNVSGSMAADIKSLNDSFDQHTQTYSAGSYFPVKFKDTVITPANFSAYFFVAAKSRNAEADGICGIVRCVRIDGVDSATYTPVYTPTGKANMMISSSTNNLVCNFQSGTEASFLIIRMGY